MKKIILIITICSVLAITFFYFYNAKNNYNLLNKETNKINNSIKKKTSRIILLKDGMMDSIDSILILCKKNILKFCNITNL